LLTVNFKAMGTLHNRQEEKGNDRDQKIATGVYLIFAATHHRTVER